MVRLTISEEQARILSESRSPLMVTDPQGRLVGSVSPLSEQDAADVEQALKNIEADKADPRESMTTKQLISHLRSLAPE